MLARDGRGDPDSETSKRCSGPVAPRDKSVIVGVYPWNYGYIMIYLA